LETPLSCHIVIFGIQGISRKQDSPTKAKRHEIEEGHKRFEYSRIPYQNGSLTQNDHTIRFVNLCKLLIHADAFQKITEGILVLNDPAVYTRELGYINIIVFGTRDGGVQAG
jgi:hypothetical protein